MTKLVRTILVALLALCWQLTCAFVIIARSPTGSPATSTNNNSRLYMTKLVYNGKAKDFPPGSPLSRAVAQLGVPVKYSCKKGDCATCQIRVAGQAMKCCIGKVPPEPRLKSLQERGLEIRA